MSAMPEFISGMDMISTGNNQFISMEISQGRIAAVTVLGNRKAQEDCFGYLEDEGGVLLCLCDGMGGQNGGDLAARTAVERILAGFESLHGSPVQAVLEASAVAADECVYQLKDDEGKRLSAGTTMVAAVIKDHDLYWASVGDSRLYIFRKGILKQITQDQNYLTVLEEQLRAGMIGEAEFEERKKHGAELINYVGIGNLSFIDHSENSLELKKDDMVLLCTDGLYRLLSDRELTIILNAFSEPERILESIEKEARLAADNRRTRRDNMTVMIMKIR